MPGLGTAIKACEGVHSHALVHGGSAAAVDVDAGHEPQAGASSLRVPPQLLHRPRLPPKLQPAARTLAPIARIPRSAVVRVARNGECACDVCGMLVARHGDLVAGEADDLEG